VERFTPLLKTAQANIETTQAEYKKQLKLAQTAKVAPD